MSERPRENGPGRPAEPECASSLLRRLPSVDQVVRAVEAQVAGTRAGEAATGPGTGPWPTLPRAETVRAAREALTSLRSLVAALPVPPAAAPARAGSERGVAALTREELLAMAVSATRRALAASNRPSLRPVINATGVVLHTNLGRARLAPEAALAAALAGGHVSLELSLADGSRRSRQEHVRGLLAALTGAEDALVVNNNAAAVWLVLRNISRGRPVVISRGELVEIGESFRLPDIMAEAGITLVEVGTTNRTTAADYARALGLGTASSPGRTEPGGSLCPGAPGTGREPQGPGQETSPAGPAAVVLVHPSNYRIVGFASRPARREIVVLARAAGVPVVEDLGSGALHDLSPWGFKGEPVAREALAEGVDLVTFSGDKLLGGPQCGVIAGKAALLSRLRADPILRCLRPDKLTLAALEATLRLHQDRETALARVPVLKALTESPETVRRRAARALRLLHGYLARLDYGLSLVQTTAEAGGGSLPATELPSWAIRITHPSLSPDDLWRRLAAADPPVLGRRHHEAFLLDFRSVADAEAVSLAGTVAKVLLDAGDAPQEGRERTEEGQPGKDVSGEGKTGKGRR